MRADEWISWNHIKARSGVNWTNYWSTRTPSNLVLRRLSETSIKLDWANGNAGE